MDWLGSSELYEIPIKGILTSPLFIDGKVNEHTKDVLIHIVKKLNEEKVISELFMEIVNSCSDIQEEAKSFLSTFKWKLPPMNKSPSYKYFESQIKGWDFEIWKIDDYNILIDLFIFMFNDLNLLEIFKVPENKFREFLYDVKCGYKDVAYHSLRHGFDVTHSCYLFLIQTKLSKVLTPLDIFALLLSAVIHDIGHNGSSNRLLVKSGSPLALVYNDKSVLENYHCYFGFKLMLKHGILDHLNEKEYLFFRKIVIEAVLETDLSKHHKLILKLDNISSHFDQDNEEHRRALVVAILKCSDVSNPIKPFPIAMRWSEAIQEEFYAQGDLLKSLGKEVPTEMCRSQYNCTIDSQIKFVDFIVMPLFVKMSKCVPKFSEFVKRLKENRTKWSELDIETKNKSEIIGGEVTNK